MSPLVRAWMEKVVASRNDWATFKSLIRPDEETLRILESGTLLQPDSPVYIPEVCRIKRTDFYNLRLAYLKGRAQLDVRCRESLIKYVELIKYEGGISTFEERNMGRY